MPNFDRIAICPYYIADKRKSISCEDVFRTFPDVKHKNHWMDQYCCVWDYRLCPYAADLNRMYDRIEKGADVTITEYEQRYKALDQEIRAQSKRLGRTEKRVERQQKKIDELRAVNQRLTDVNIQLDQRMKRYYKDAQAAKEQLDEYERKVAEQVSKLTETYEQRMAYLIEVFCPTKSFYEDNARAWAGDKAFAVIIDPDVLAEDHRIMWKVVYADDGENDDAQSAE